MRYTLLEATQLILSSLDSDEVNSISDTVESNQVALLLKSVYYDIATELNLDEHHSLFELNPSLDPTQPTLMSVPSNVTNIEWVEYDCRELGETYPDNQRIEFVMLDEFLSRQNALRNETANVGELNFTVHSESFSTMYYNNRRPHCYTTLDDYTLLFDSYDATVDTTLQKSKTRCAGRMIPEFTMSDSFIPDFNPQQFSYYMNRAKVRAFAELKQAANQEAASEAHKQKVALQKRKRTVENIPEVFRVGARYGRMVPMTTPYYVPKYLRSGD